MKKQELAGFVLKLIGAYALIQSLPQLQSIVVIMGGLAREGHELPNAFWLYIGMMLPFVLMLLTGIVLIVYSRPFGRILFRKDNSSEIESGICSEEFQAIGFSIVAVLIVLQAIPRIGHFVVNLWQLMRNDIPHGMGDWFIRSTWQVGIIARPKSFATILLDILSIFDIVEVCKQQNIHIQLLKFENEL